MNINFQSIEWHRSVAAIVAARSARNIAAALASAIDKVANHEGTCLIAFHRDARPTVLHHTLEPAGRKHYLERYLDGPYLLDPLYQLSLTRKKPDLCRFRDESPDRFRSSEYYRQYCERTHLLDEMDYVAPVSARTAVTLVVGRRSRRFAKSELHGLQSIEPLVQATLQKIWETWTAQTDSVRGEDDVHQRLTACFTTFGQSTLTAREREISQLLLRGHSSRAIARELKIAPGTVVVHKRNLFAKLGISSQFELFSLFLDDLAGM